MHGQPSRVLPAMTASFSNSVCSAPAWPSSMNGARFAILLELGTTVAVIVGIASGFSGGIRDGLILISFLIR